jgi:hypothetical protein
LQQDGLHMTGCFLADSVKHATHLFLDMGFGLVLVWLAGPEDCYSSRPGTGYGTAHGSSSASLSGGVFSSKLLPSMSR